MALKPQYLTAAEAAEVLRVEAIAVVRMCRAAKIPATNPTGRRWLIDPDDLAAFIEAGRNDEQAAS